MATNAPQDDFQKTALRLPKELHARVHAEAAESGRSYNSQLIHIVQEYFDSIERDVNKLTTALENDKAEWSEFGLASWADRNAVLKVLLFDEILMLRRRVDRLGGREAVGKLPKREIVRLVGDEKLQPTPGDRTTLFTQTLGTWPLTALLTEDEIGHLAKRIVAMQDAVKAPHTELQAPTPATAEELRKAQEAPIRAQMAAAVPKVRAPLDAREPTPQTREEMRRGVEEAKAAYLAAQKELDELPPLPEEKSPAQAKQILATKRMKKA